MTLEEFVEQAKAGTLLTESGGLEGGKFESAMAPLDADDPVAITIEAFQVGAIGHEVPWDEALEQVTRLLG